MGEESVLVRWDPNSTFFCGINHVEQKMDTVPTVNYGNKKLMQGPKHLT